MLIAGRVVEGLGGGGLDGQAKTVIGEPAPRRDAGKDAVYISGTWAIASIAGPVLGGVITDHLHWSVIFWLDLPVALFAFAMTNETLKRLPWARRDHKLDLPGAGLTILGTGAFLLALTLAPQADYGWGSAVVLGLLGAAAVLTLATAWHFSRSSEPLVPLAVLKNRVVLTATLSVFFAMASFVDCPCSSRCSCNSSWG